MNNINIQDNLRTRTHSMVVGNKRIYHAMKNLNSINVEFNNIDISEEKENVENIETEDCENPLLNNKKDISLTTS